METPLTLEEKRATTRRLLAEFHSPHGRPRLDVAKILSVEIAAGRAVPVAQLQDPPPPVRLRTGAATVHLRTVVWQALHDEGLEGELSVWLSEMAEMEGLPAPVGRPEFNNANVALAMELLIDHRSLGHPWLQQTDALDLDAPVFQKGFTAPGLGLQPCSNQVRAKVVHGLGGAREIVPVVHPPMYNAPRESYLWLLPAEVYDYLEHWDF